MMMGDMMDPMEVGNVDQLRDMPILPERERMANVCYHKHHDDTNMIIYKHYTITISSYHIISYLCSYK